MPFTKRWRWRYVCESFKHHKIKRSVHFVLFRFYLFIYIFWRTQVLFVGPLIHRFWTSGDISSGFQSQSGQPYSHLAEVYMLHIPRDLPANLLAGTADLLAGSISAKPFSSTYLWADIGGAPNGDLLCHRSQCETRQADTLPTALWRLGSDQPNLGKSQKARLVMISPTRWVDVSTYERSLHRVDVSLLPYFDFRTDTSWFSV